VIKHGGKAMSDQPVISKDPDVLGGAVVFHGTRVMVQTLIDYLTEGDTIDTFLDDFPTVTREQVVAFLGAVKL
jgi:uncharacterized protein (DUF433 family)